jgi:phage terminase small subunit
MPTLPNAKHELFCQNLAKGMTQEKAYVEAGYKPNRFNASALKTKQHIAKRLDELLTRNITKQDEVIAISAESLMREAEEARVKAMELGQTSAAIQAIVAKGKLGGVWVERSERTNIKGDLESLSDAELAAIVRQGQPEPVPVSPQAKKLN